MGNIPSVDILKQDGNLNILSSSNDGDGGLLIYGSHSLAITTIYGEEDILDLGIAKDSVFHYNVKEYFRGNNGQYPLTVYFKTTNPSTFSEIEEMHLATGGTIKYYGILNLNTTFNTTHTTAINTIMDSLEGNEKNPSAAIYQAMFTSITAQASVTLALGNEQVSVVYSESASGVGKTIRTETGKTASHVGLALGVKSGGKVSESIGYVAAKPLSDGIENNDIAFSDSSGTLYKSKNATFFETLHNTHAIFARKIPNRSNCYFNKDWTCAASNSDFQTLVNTSTWNKAYRAIYGYATDFINSPAKIDKSTGYVDASYIKQVQDRLSIPLNTMVDNQELSGFTVKIDRAQDILSTHSLYITVQIIPYGTVEKLIIKLPLGSQV